MLLRTAMSTRSPFRMTKRFSAPHHPVQLFLQLFEVAVDISDVRVCQGQNVDLLELAQIVLDYLHTLYPLFIGGPATAGSPVLPAHRGTLPFIGARERSRTSSLPITNRMHHHLCYPCVFAGFPPAHRLSYARMPSETAQRSCGRKEADELQRKSGAAG